MAETPRADEIWLYDSYGRFLHNDSLDDRLVACAPADLPNGLPGVIFGIDPMRSSDPFVLLKRETRPMPLPQIEPVMEQGVALAFRILDSEGPYADARGGYVSTQQDGSVALGAPGRGEGILFAPMPFYTARSLFPDAGIELTDSHGLVAPSPQPLTGMRVQIAGRPYSLEVGGDLLARMGELSPGETVSLVLPATATEPEKTITATRKA
ncbi:MAG: hypothetical protein ABF876_00475 [Acetobacter aceti]|uniref:Uncharacterized protein n=1 Tax=Acetobacter aceti TaxID=435 RepID=A0A1U9KCH2_ACEAC|nr:hypothetical protein [Acetobacter aceti]AQS83513.1 hypothetical protein A0U92_00660 [Acetobacter aceti]